MTASTEGRTGGLATEPPFDAVWRAAREREQQQAVPAGRLAVSCSAPFGVGGLGRHLREIAEASVRGGGAPTCVCAPGGPGPRAGTRLEVPQSRGQRLAAGLLRRSAPWRMWAASAGFDRAAARVAPECDHLIAFSSQALLQLRAARRRGVGSLGLVAATSHLGEVDERYRRACRRHPCERPWTPRVLARSLAEYRLAERIYVATPYVRESFLRAGFDEGRLVLLPLTPDPRYAPAQPSGQSRFEVLYVGSLSVVKGVPLLVEALRRLPAADLRLRLHGGWESRGMRRWLEAARTADPRIEICSGDPLASMRAASLYAQPSYEDGFGYSAAEALACGIPVLASENTGMKSLLVPGRTGEVLPTGDVDALAQAIEAAYEGRLVAR